MTSTPVALPLRLVFAALVAALSLSVPLPARALSGDDARLAAAMTEVRARNWDGAFAALRRDDRLAQDIVEWHRLRDGAGTSIEYIDFLHRNPDWPGLPLLRKQGEASLTVGARPEETFAYFDEGLPQTMAGALALAVAFETGGMRGDAEAQAALSWLTHVGTEDDEAALLDRYGAALDGLHEARLDMLLWRNAAAAVERMLPRVGPGWQALARARMALRNDGTGVDALIERVPEALRDDAGLAFERFNWRANKGRTADAIEIMLERGGDPDRLGEPGRWASWRRSLARAEMRAGNATRAYRMASEHGLFEGSNYADLEWLAGFIKLRYLGDPDGALVHFGNHEAAVDTPISLGRAGYWKGRALEAKGERAAAMAAYREGARHQTSFYGLLAAEKAGVATDPDLVGNSSHGDWRNASFAGSSVFKAVQRLHAAGERRLAARFSAHLAETLDDDDRGRLVEYALEVDAPFVALWTAKRAAAYGTVLPRAYFPITGLGAEPLPVEPELALAIARRESEFHPEVRSPAGARGLMQVMPGTGEEMAGKIGMDFDLELLSTDPDYNTRIGSAYLAELKREFGDTYVLVAAAYNAGPSRARRWSQERGHPGSPRVDVVDWIEHIPFRETRNYVMRVTESIFVYKVRLAGKPLPIRFTDLLKGR